jgi:hypothetical protein
MPLAGNALRQIVTPTSSITSAAAITFEPVDGGMWG